MSPILAAILGAVSKVLSYLFTAYIESRNLQKQYDHEFRMAAANRKPRAFNRGFDAASDSTRGTRRVLAIMVACCFCFLVGVCAVHPDAQFAVRVAKDGGFFGFLFGGLSDATLQVSLGSLLFPILDIIAYCFTFYFTPVGSSVKGK